MTLRNVAALPTQTPDIWRALTAVSAALLAVMVLWALSGETRAIGGVPVWLKPAKFSLSFVVLGATIALVADRLSPQVRNGWPMFIVAMAMGLAFLAEMGWIIAQAAQGRGSHFNQSTPLEEFMFTTVMFGGAVVLVAGVAAVGWLAYRDRAAAMGPALREGVWLGFFATFVLTMIVGMTIGAGMSSYVGVHPPGAPSVPLFGWSGVTGDLRPAHFVALHAMQALPLVGLLADRFAHRQGVRIVQVAAVGWAGLTVALFVQALAGIPLIPLAG